jgi:hypothetical protein
MAIKAVARDECGTHRGEPRSWPRLLIVALIVVIVAAYGYRAYRIQRDRDNRIRAEQIQRNSERIRLAKAISNDRLRVKNDQLRIDTLKAKGSDTRDAKALLQSDQAQLAADERAWEEFQRKVQRVSDRRKPSAYRVNALLRTPKAISLHADMNDCRLGSTNGGSRAPDALSHSVPCICLDLLVCSERNGGGFRESPRPVTLRNAGRSPSLYSNQNLRDS